MRKKAVQQIQKILMRKDNHILVLLMFFTISSCVNLAEKEIVYIPENYVGTIAIVFNQMEGAPKEYNGASRVYRIPESGVLYSQFSQPDKGSYLNQELFFIDRDSTVLEEIYDADDYINKKILRNQIYKFEMFNMSVLNNKSSRKDDYIRSIYFSIGEIQLKDSLIRTSHKKMENLMRTLAK